MLTINNIFIFSTGIIMILECVEVQETMMTWDNAKKSCEANGMELATYKSFSELSNISSSEYHWIGTSWVSTLQQFQWVDGSLWSINDAIFPYKSTSEPNCLEGYNESCIPYQNCIFFQYTKFASQRCNNTYKSLCQTIPLVTEVASTNSITTNSITTNSITTNSIATNSITTNSITTNSITTTSSVAECTCNIAEVRDTSSNTQTFSSFKVQVKTTSAYRRSLVSASDDRVSSAVIGYMGVFIICLVLAVPLLFDVLTILMRNKDKNIPCAVC